MVSVMSFGVVTSVVLSVVRMACGVRARPADHEQQGNRQPTPHKVPLPVLPYIHQNRNLVCLSKGGVHPGRNVELRLLLPGGQTIFDPHSKPVLVESADQGVWR